MNAEKISIRKRIRNEINEIVTSIKPGDCLEKDHVDFVKAWIASGAEMFRLEKPDHPNIHLVAYFMVIDPNSNEYLLVDHKKAGLWLPPGGHVEPNEHPKDTVKREIKEELGVEAEFLFEDPLFITATKTTGHGPSHTDVSLWYLLKGRRDVNIEFDKEEFHQIQWFSLNDIPYERTDPHLKRFIDKIYKKLATLNTYNASAMQYANNTEPLHPKEDAQKFMSRLPVQAKILDIGCGPGRDAKIFSEQGFEVRGIDFSHEMVELARRNAPHCAFDVMDIEKLAFFPETFDGVWASCALLHIPKNNMLAVLQKIHAILKPEGLLYISVKQGAEEVVERDARYAGLEKFWSYYEQKELMDLLCQANFKIQDIEQAGKSSPYNTHPIIKIFAEKT